MSFRFPEPREFKKRTCFKCNRSIEFGEFYFKNKDLPKERLIELWQSENIQFYCCLCYDQLINKQKAERLRHQLSEKQKDLLKIIEIKIGRRLPIVPSITYNSIGFSTREEDIIGLSLFRMNLYHFPEEIISLNKLESLNLAWNYLEMIPSSIDSLISLRELDLIGNELKAIPESICRLNNLELIDLSFNNLKSIPECMGEMESLVLLKLIKNKIREIPPSLENLEKIRLKLLL
ncbi:MAG: leucine-rich repeat domain-containing protein [Promethearchaeati archaeon]